MSDAGGFMIAFTIFNPVNPVIIYLSESTVQEKLGCCPDASIVWCFVRFLVVTVHESLNFCTHVGIGSITSGNPHRFTLMGAIKDLYY